jgi:hypothetical protein
MVWLGNPSNESENIALAHDQIVFTIHLDLGATVFRDQDFVADFDVLYLSGSGPEPWNASRDHRRRAAQAAGVSSATWLIWKLGKMN